MGWDALRLTTALPQLPFHAPPTTSDGLLMHISNRCHPVDAGQVRQGHHHEGPSPSYWAASAHAEVWGSPGDSLMCPLILPSRAKE